MVSSLTAFLTYNKLESSEKVILALSVKNFKDHP